VATAKRAALHLPPLLKSGHGGGGGNTTTPLCFPLFSFSLNT
jgi:hypothetical protein